MKRHPLRVRAQALAAALTLAVAVSPAVVRAFPLLLWPMEFALNQGTPLGNYVDDDSANGVVHDYMGGDGANDGHGGTDFGILSFRAMDRGTEIRAAASGIVQWKQDGKFDRSLGAPWPDDGNYLGIQHADGSVAWYLHLRKHSLVVDVGEAVSAGQMIAFGGSSGFAWGPHLHFEIGEYSPAWTLRDPWHGSYNALPSLWQSQAPYVGNVPAIVHDLGVVTRSLAGGSYAGITYEQLLEGFVPAATYGAAEPDLAMWIVFQGNPGGSFTMEVRRPNGSLYWTATFPIGFKAFPQTGIFPFGWNGSVGPSDFGTWTARGLVGGTPIVTKAFVVGASTSYAPRLRPAGRSYRMNGAIQRDTLRVDALGGPATFSLVGAPSFVALESDSVLRIGATGTQPTRSLFFQILATNAAAERDTMWCHIVDPSKPLGGGTGIAEVFAPGDDMLQLLPCFPNPFRETTRIRFTAAAGALPRVTIFDVGGRSVRRIAGGTTETAGEVRTVAWDGRDDAGRPLPAGVYFVRLETPGAAATAKALRLK